jgi:GMP synthase (glutamine-hydrolysing)
MRKPFDQLRVLLLQARATEDMELQEQACFMERSRIESHQLITVNVVRHRLHPGLLDGMDAFMIGGAGEFSATKEYVWMGDALDLIRAAVDRGIPTFGSCWGHQMLARAFGGRVLHDHARAEMGCHGVELTGAGIRDDLFSGFPGRFLANMGHHDRVVTLPPGAVELAFNASQPNQAFRLDGTVAYGTQLPLVLRSGAGERGIVPGHPGVARGDDRSGPPPARFPGGLRRRRSPRDALTRHAQERTSITDRRGDGLTRFPGPSRRISCGSPPPAISATRDRSSGHSTGWFRNDA